MNKLRLVGLASMFLMVSTASSANVSVQPTCERIKASGNAEYPPYLWREPDHPKRFNGAIAFLMEDISAYLGIEIDLHYEGSWGRVQAEVAAGYIDMITGAFFTTPRAEYMDYIYPEFQGTNTAVWVNKDKTFAYKEWKDLIPYQGITVINNSFGEKFDEYAKQYLSIEEVGQLNQGLGMLSLKRVDYLIYEENPGLAYIERQGITNLEALPVKVSSENLYITISKKSSCNTPEIKQALSNIVAKFNQQGRMQWYLDRALKLWKQQQKAAQK
ncbi:substrate-binding periplasmic protein [Litoribrevibacter euphylliae]